MIKKTITVELEGGLEARAIAHFVQKACLFDSLVTVSRGEKRANAKSIMGMMSLSVSEGEELQIEAEGPDEEEAVCAIEEYLKEGK